MLLLTIIVLFFSSIFLSVIIIGGWPGSFPLAVAWILLCVYVMVGALSSDSCNEHVKTFQQEAVDLGYADWGGDSTTDYGYPHFRWRTWTNLNGEEGGE